MHKIVIIDHEPFTQRRKDLFFIQNFIDEGFDIQVWDISQYFFGRIHVHGMLDDQIYLREIKDFEQIKSLLSCTDISHTIFWLEYFDVWKNRSLSRILSDFHCYTIRVDLFANSNLYEPFTSKLQRLFSSSFGKIFKNRMLNIAYKLYKKIYNIKDVNRYLSSSALVHRTDIINHPDYERFRSNNNPPIIQGEYIVFCDTYFPYHPDLVTFYNCKNLPDGRAYQNTLKCFFDYLEDKYKMPVIIAAHPKADYEGGEYGNRRIIQNNTDNLVLNSNIVVQHASNSVSYAILKNKPIVFVTTDDYDRVLHLKNRLALLASILGKIVYNLDAVSFDEITISSIEQNLREHYIYTYLTSPQIENKTNWEILKEIIIQIDPSVSVQK